MGREEEHKKYIECYKGVYGMGKQRKLAAHEAIDSLNLTGSLLDVGCGRGEILEYARNNGFDFVRGVDVVPDLLVDDALFGEAYDLPFSENEFDVVTCFDVIEHILPQDTEAVLKELNRVSRCAVVLCIANFVSKQNGVNLHINIRHYKAWDKLIHKHIHGEVKWLPKTNNTHSETWVITKE